MPLDTSIYQNIRPAQIEAPDPLGSLAKAMSLGNAGLQYKQLQQQAGDQDAIRSALAGNIDPVTGKPNISAATASLYKSNPTAGLAFEAQRAQADKAAADAKHESLKVQRQDLALLGHLVEGATDQTTWDNALSHGSKLVPPEVMASFPKQFDPAFAKKIQTAALDGIERINGMSTISKTANDNAKAPLEREHIKAQTAKEWAEAGKASNNNLPPENQEQIKKLAERNAGKVGIATQIESTLQTLQDKNVTPDQKLMQARQLIKVLNSTEGQDAVGAEESKRLAGLLEYRMGNVLEPGKFWGRDMEGFMTQAALTARGLKSAVQTNQGIIAQLKSGQPLQVTVPSIESITQKPAAPVTGGNRRFGGMQTAYAADKPSPKVAESAKAAKMEPAAFVKATAEANGIDEATAARLIEEHL